jgi:hypothetical protein
MGGIKSVECNSLAYDIWSWCINRDIWVSANYVHTSENIADVESRKFNDNIELMLNKNIFKLLIEIWGTPDIDLFATRLNNQLSTYSSWKPDPGCKFIDTFTVIMVKFIFLYIYSFQFVGKSCSEITKRSSREYSDSTDLADPELVCRFTTAIDRQSYYTSNERQFVNNASHGQSSSATEHINVDNVSCLRKSFESYKLSSKTTDIILASWRHGTKTQYSTYIRKCTLYCREKQIDTLQCSLSHILEFLTDLYEKHMSYSSINSARSVLSAMDIVRDSV